MEINGSSAIVTGGARASARPRPASWPVEVPKSFVADLNADAGEALAKEIGGVFVRTDVTSTDDVIASVDAAHPPRHPCSAW